MNISKIKYKYMQILKSRARLDYHLDSLLVLILEHYDENQELMLSEVGGDGFVINFNNGFDVCPIDYIIKIIETNGIFSDSDLKNGSI